MEDTKAMSQRLEEDAEKGHREQAADNDKPSDGDGTVSEQGRKRAVAWEPDDPENPHNWSKVRPGHPFFGTLDYSTDVHCRRRRCLYS